MRALVLDGRLRLETRYPDPQPTPGSALVRVRYAGICRTDLELLRGYMGFRGVPGHEFVGTVVQCDDEAFEQALATAARPEALKVLLRVSGT